jgi:hypothetical protein
MFNSPFTAFIRHLNAVFAPGDLWLVEASPVDALPLERPEDIEYIGLGDTVTYTGEFVTYVGEVIDVDYVTDRALVKVSESYQFWAGVERLELTPEKATACAAAFAALQAI